MRLGLIAMSGLRVVDEELLRLGMTVPGFLERSKTIASLPSLGLLTLAGMTPPRFEVEYLEAEDLRSRDDWPTFDLVAISCLTAQAFDAYEIADLYRARGTAVVIGGLHATAVPEEVLEHADAVVVGEGELCWPEILRDAESGSMHGIYRAASPRHPATSRREFDLADAPMPAFEMLDLEKYNRLTVQTTRGCPWRCEFCASSILLTSKYKHKPIERVLAEVDRIGAMWSRPFLEFADDNSFVNKAYWKRLLPELAKRRVRWFTETDLSVADDPELLMMMREAGCVEVLIGLESPSDCGLEGLELRRDWKLTQRPRHTEAVRAIQSQGIRVNGCFILGLDGHTPAIFDRVFEAATAMELYDVQITLQTPFPGTPLFARLRDTGRLHEARPWRRCTLFDLVYEPRGMSAEELTTGFRNLARRLYSAEMTAWRREIFKEKYYRLTG